MSEESNALVKKLFDPTTVVMAILLSLLTWGATQLVSVKVVQASILSEQMEDRRVNEIVYSAIPEIQISISKLQESHKALSKDINSLINEAKIARTIETSTDLTDEYIKNKPISLKDGAYVIINDIKEIESKHN